MYETSTAAFLVPSVTTRRLAPHEVCLEGRGDLDLVAVPLFREAMSAAIAEGHRHVVIDLGEATFLDCACLGAILAGMRPLRAVRDATLVLASATGSVARLLALLDVDLTCPIVSSVLAATTLALAPDGAGGEGWRADEPSTDTREDIHAPAGSGPER